MKYFSCLLLFLLSFTVAAQKTRNIWHFGKYASLDFNSGKPVATNFSKLWTYEGCTSVADDNGNLLFYSDGITVWNNNHLPMQNGTGLMGNNSATQSVIAVPKPGSVGIYCLFTVDAMENGLQNGLRYSVVDLGQNNGAGAVTTKNVLLEAPVLEKLVVIRHANRMDYWILVHKWDSDVISAYLLTNSGISTSPVINRTGVKHTGTWDIAIGGMKGSPSGSKLALTSNRKAFELYDFNNATGILSNGRISAPTYILPYDVEFSPDETKLYGSAHQNVIYQFDLTSPTVFSTGIQIALSNSNGTVGALQLGPDNKIYKARNFSQHLAVINNPNQRGVACNYVHDGVYLGGSVSQNGAIRESISGLPNFPTGGFTIDSIAFEGKCVGKATLFSIPNYLPTFQFSWNFGDPASNTLNQASGPAAAHVFNTPGKYTVTLNINNNGFTRTITRDIMIDSMPDASLGKDTVLCEGRSYTIIKPDLPGVNYLWQDGSTGNSYTINKPGTYKLQAERNNCVAIDSFNVTYINCPIPALPNIITPSNDGLNDKFIVSDLYGNNLNLVIFNRWGVRVYESHNYSNDWDAKGVSAGLYYYLLQNKQSGKSYKGWIEVVK